LEIASKSGVSPLHAELSQLPLLKKMNPIRNDAASHLESHNGSRMSKFAFPEMISQFTEVLQAQLRVSTATIGRSGVMLPKGAFPVPIASTLGVPIALCIRSGKDMRLGDQIVM
jgi:hypothetical protein